jgi:hypothetical protein
MIWVCTSHWVLESLVLGAGRVYLVLKTEKGHCYCRRTSGVRQFEVQVTERGWRLRFVVHRRGTSWGSGGNNGGAHPAAVDGGQGARGGPEDAGENGGSRRCSG